MGIHCPACLSLWLWWGPLIIKFQEGLNYKWFLMVDPNAEYHSPAVTCKLIRKHVCLTSRQNCVHTNMCLCVCVWCGCIADGTGRKLIKFLGPKLWGDFVESAQSREALMEANSPACYLSIKRQSSANKRSDALWARRVLSVLRLRLHHSKEVLPMPRCSTLSLSSPSPALVVWWVSQP